MQIRFIGPWVGLIRGLAVAAVAFMPAIDTSATPPANDNFADRIIIQQPPPGGSIMVTGTLNGATVEQGELSTGNMLLYYNQLGLVPNKSVWWELVMNNSGFPVMIEVMERTETDRMNILFVHSRTNSDASAFPISGPYVNDLSSTVVFYPELLRAGWLMLTNGGGDGRYFQVLGVDARSQFTLRLTTTNIAPFTAGPLSQTVRTNDSVLFSASSHPSLIGGYQWLHDGVPMAGETNKLLALNGVTMSHAGVYSVIATNLDYNPPIYGGGHGLMAITSTVAHLTVLETDIPPKLDSLEISPVGKFSFRLAGSIGRYYRVESSTNLTQWSPEVSFVNGHEYFAPRLGSVIYSTNGADVFSLPIVSTNKFIRASIYRPANAVCNNNLKVLRFAKEDFAINAWRPIWDSFSLGLLERSLYFKGVMPVCPDGGTYTPGKVGELPTCSIPGHVLEEPR